MPANFGTTPYSAETLPANTFPVSAVFVPNTSSGNLTAMQGGPATTDTNGYVSAPGAIYVADGSDVTLGTTTDASSANTVIGLLKNIKASVASVTVGSLPALPAGSNTIGNVGIVAGSAVIGHVIVDSGTITANAGTGPFPTAGMVASGAANANNPVKTGGVFNTTQPTVTNAQIVDAQYTARGAAIVATGVDTFATSASQSGTWNITNVSGTVSLPTGAATAAKQPALGTAGSASADVISIQGIASMTAVKVDGSGVTQPVSGTFWQSTQPISGTVTANVGTTNGLALDTSVNGVIVAQGSTTSGEKGPMVQGAVTTAAPTYTTAQTSPLSLTTAGALRVDGSATTQPVSVASLPALPAHQSANVDQWNGTTVDTNSGTKSAGTVRVVLATDQPALTNKLLVTPDSVALPAHQSTNVDQWNGTTTDTNSGTKSAGTLRVVIATDQPALTNTLLVQTQAGTSGGSTPFHVISAASNNATSLKASAGLLYGGSVSNTNAAARYLKFYNKASAPAPATDNALIVWTIQVPANGIVPFVVPEGVTCSTGIAFAAVANMSDTDNTSIGAGDLSIDIRYK